MGNFRVHNRDGRLDWVKANHVVHRSRHRSGLGRYYQGDGDKQPPDQRVSGNISFPRA